MGNGLKMCFLVSTECVSKQRFAWAMCACEFCIQAVYDLDVNNVLRHNRHPVYRTNLVLLNDQYLSRVHCRGVGGASGAFSLDWPGFLVQEPLSSKCHTIIISTVQ